MKQNSKWIAALTCALTATPALADVAYETVQSGGYGGQEFDTECSYGFAKGLALRSATYIDRVGLRCVDRASGRIASLNTQFGGTGGNAYTTTCKTGFVLKGLAGRAANFVDRLQLICVEEADVAKASDASGETLDFNYPAFGGTGGQYFSMRCGGGDAAIGMHGASGTYVDRIGLWCKDTGNF